MPVPLEVPDFAAFIESDPRDFDEPDSIGQVECECLAIGDEINPHCGHCRGYGYVTDARMRELGLV